MSTHAVVCFMPLNYQPHRMSKPEAMVYVHFDGYPEGLGRDLLLFLDIDVEARMSYGDPIALAGRFIAWKHELVKRLRREFDEQRDQIPVLPESERPGPVMVGPIMSLDDVGVGYTYYITPVTPGQRPTVVVDGYVRDQFRLSMHVEDALLERVQWC